MMLADHLAKAARYEAALRKLDPVEDLALVVWSSMNCGTNLVNAALHDLGVTDERAEFATHEEHSYVTANAPGHERVRYERGDLIHIDMPRLPGEPPVAIVPAMQALAAIERMRGAFVRSAAPYTAEGAAQCAAHLATVKEVCYGILGNAARR